MINLGRNVGVDRCISPIQPDQHLARHRGIVWGLHCTLPPGAPDRVQAAICTSLRLVYLSDRKMTIGRPRDDEASTGMFWTARSYINVE
nr:hypothetical protein CFP56_04439 [Quercus suber]